MRAAVAAAFVLLGAPTPLPGGPVAIGGHGSAVVHALPDTAGARPAALTVAVRTELQCGRPRPGTVLVRLPQAMHVPASIPRSAVHVGARTAASVSLAGHVAAIGVPRPAGLLCDSLAPGTLTVSFARAAGLGNPTRAGSYTVGVTVGGIAATAPLIIA